MADASELEQLLSYRFQRPQWLQQALTHGSWREHTGEADYERLEFLGDAVLELRVRERLLQAFPDASEGDLSRQRAWMVSAANLAEVARQLGLGRFLRLCPPAGAQSRPSRRLLANVVESLTAAVYLDGGYAAASALVDRILVNPALQQLASAERPAYGFKTALQEWTQARGQALPAYHLLDASGPDHDRHFTVEVALADGSAATGTGPTKKAAEQQAAASVLALLALRSPTR
ncbi:MAG: ribonuclease III [Terriglobales bacterium]